ncbi:hypothetical protein ACFP8W_04070 [Nocardioides hankookensis]|uniref:DUF4190 domain-containing protein n=1 Tax=Nocardioides hankookensis TaxID=443157 RepID=A0ABW1LQ84_9ACTN
MAAVSCVGSIAAWWLLSAVGADAVASWVLTMFGISLGFILMIDDRRRSWGMGLAIGFGIVALGEVVMFVAFLSWLGAHTA